MRSRTRIRGWMFKEFPWKGFFLLKFLKLDLTIFGEFIFQGKRKEIGTLLLHGNL